MSNSTYFDRDCPTCGRRLQIRVEHLGKAVVCQHCQAEFEALDPANLRYDPAEQENSLLRRADQLLRKVDLRSPESESSSSR